MQGRTFERVVETVFWIAVVAALSFTFEQKWQAAAVACLWAILAAVVAAGLGVEGRLDRLRETVENKLDEILTVIPNPSAKDELEEILAGIPDGHANEERHGPEGSAGKE